MDESPARPPTAQQPTAPEPGGRPPAGSPTAHAPPDRTPPPDAAPPPDPAPSSSSELAAELRVRVVEAQTALDAAQVLDEPLIAQIAEADLADLRALAARNDVDLGDVEL